MIEPFLEGVPWSSDDMHMAILSGQPPAGFDCGAPHQNRFLYERAWRDQKRGVSVTHVLNVKGILAAYVTLVADRIQLGPDEKPRGVTWRQIGAIKVGQLGVARSFGGCGLGRFMIGYSIEHALALRGMVGCRYVTLDAEPHLVPWYQAHGFIRNREEKAYRQQVALDTGRGVDDLPVSMRFDLREPGALR
jgi:predicted GNAT family N-acyltransferase